MDFEGVLSELKGQLGAKGKKLDLFEREKLYSIAYGKYQAGEYGQAAEMFTQLVLHDPHEVRFWNGLAGAKQMDHDFQGALRAWGVMSLLGNHPPEAHYHAAECCLSLGEIEEAKKALECAKLHLDENHPLFDRIETLHTQVRQ